MISKNRKRRRLRKKINESIKWNKIVTRIVDEKTGKVTLKYSHMTREEAIAEYMANRPPRAEFTSGAFAPKKKKAA